MNVWQEWADYFEQVDRIDWENLSTDNTLSIADYVAAHMFPALRIKIKDVIETPSYGQDIQIFLNIEESKCLLNLFQLIDEDTRSVKPPLTWRKEFNTDHMIVTLMGLTNELIFEKMRNLL